MSLNPDQKKAVFCDNHCLVVACPGSGKTKLLVSRIAHILNTHDDPRIIATTYTRDAAKELKERVTKEIVSEHGKERGELLAKRVHASTFHSLAFSHLRKHDFDIRIAKESETRDFLNRAVAHTGLDVSLEEAARLLQSCKTKPHYEPLNDLAGRIYTSYQEICKQNHVMDFYDVMLLSLEMVRSGALPILSPTHLMVDEFQDSDEIQYQYMMAYHSTGSVNITAVGDDDQCIYSFRESLGVDGMNRFEAEANATRITLGINYRCHREILTSADRLINHNIKRLDKQLHAHKGKGGAVEVSRYPNTNDEAMAVTLEIEKISKNNPPHPDDLPADPFQSAHIKEKEWAILARTNLQLDNLDITLRAAGIPYRKTGKSVWEKPPVSFFVTMLQSLLTDKRGGIDNLLHWAGVPAVVLAEFHKLLKQDYSNIFKPEFVKTLEVSKNIDDPSYEILEDFIQRAPGWAKEASKSSSDDRVNNAIHGLSSWMLTHAKRWHKDKIELASITLQLMKGPLGTRLERVTKKYDPKSERCVMLYTMHSSKGLEFDNVWIIGAEENIIPSPGTGGLTEAIIEEERRLMYVAMTRARNRLYVSSTTANDPSRFIAEAIPRT